MKKILILSTLDESGQGHARSWGPYFEKQGFAVTFLSFIRKDRATEHYIMDATGNGCFRYKLYQISKFLRKLPFFYSKSSRSFAQGEVYTNADEILSVANIQPDIIFIGSFINFLSPKIIRDLYEKTHAMMILSMVDDQILGGGCHYPLFCDQYLSGCKNCPRFIFGKWIPRNNFKQKEKYLSDIPFQIKGTPFDLERARKVSFMKNFVFHPSVGIPTIPFSMSKQEARDYFGLPKDDYILMIGAVSFKDRRKGFKELIHSLQNFSERNLNKRRITLISMTNNSNVFLLPPEINVKSLGFLPLQDLFKAFYACDVFLSSSLEDSGPYMVNYAIACGRPVVAFPIGIAYNLVVHKKTGYIAEYGNSSQFADGIEFFYVKDEVAYKLIEEDCKKQINSFSEFSNYDFIGNQ